MLQAGKLELSKHLIENAELQDLVFVLLFCSYFGPGFSYYVPLPPLWGQ